MKIVRDGKEYELTVDEKFKAYHEQLAEYFYEDAKMYIASMTLNPKMLENSKDVFEKFAKMMAGAAMQHNREVSNDRFESVEYVVDSYIKDHAYQFPFGSEAKNPYSKSETNLFA